MNPIARRSDPPGAALTVSGLSMQFGGIEALTDISFSVPQVGFTAIIGPNGAGKTTLFNCISGFYRGTGSIYAGGQRLDNTPSSTRSNMGVARTFQTPSLIEDATVLENIMLGFYSGTKSGVASNLLGLPWVRREERACAKMAEEIAERVGLTRHMRDRVHRLPHHQRRLVEIARGFASRPRLLLLDEPAAGSHHDEAVVMLQTVREFCEEQDVAVVLVEHNVRLVMDFAREIVVLNFGMLLAQGSPTEIQRDPDVINAYLGEVAI